MLNVKNIELEWMLSSLKGSGFLRRTPFEGYCVSNYSGNYIYSLNLEDNDVLQSVLNVEEWLIKNKISNAVFAVMSNYTNREFDLCNVLEGLDYNISRKSARMFFNPNVSFGEFRAKIDFQIKEVSNLKNNYIDCFSKVFSEGINRASEEYIRMLESLELSSKHRAFVMYDNQRPIGTISLSLNDEVNIIGDVGIIEEYRGNGLGYKLMEFIVELNSKIGQGRSLALSTGINNTGLDYRKFYKACGFETQYILSRYVKK